MNQGRPLEFDPEAALESAMRLFWARGYGATSLQDLLDHMGIARSSFYQTFHGKLDVFIRSVERYRETLMGDLRARLAASASAMAFLHGTLTSVADQAQTDSSAPAGCLVFNSAAELGQKHTRVAAVVAASIAAFNNVFADAMEQGQREGDIDSTADPTALGRYVVCTMSGLQTLAKAGASRDQLIEVAETSLSAIRSVRHSITPRPRIKRRSIMKFDVYEIDNAPEASRDTLKNVRDKYGFLPNLFGVFAESPAAAAAYAALGEAVEKTDLSPVQRQVVFVAISAENGCEYCVAAHSTLAKGAKMPDEVLSALRKGQELPDPALHALAEFTRSVNRNRGWVPDEDLRAFTDAGYERRHVLDVLTIIAMKTLSNYTNHIAGTPLDDAFADQAWNADEAAA